MPRTRTRTRTRRVTTRQVAPKKGSKKRKLNAFFKLMLKAKKNGDESFVYNGKTYKGKKQPRLGMIYKRA